MEKQRRTYPEELKRDMLELLTTSGKSATAVARDLVMTPLKKDFFQGSHHIVLFCLYWTGH